MLIFKDCDFLTKKKKYQGKVASKVYYVMNTHYILYLIERFDLISEWVLSFIKSDTMAFIEGYSFGSKDKVYFK